MKISKKLIFIRLKDDGVPAMTVFVLPTVWLAEKATLLLGSLKSYSSTQFNREDSSPLNIIVEDLAIRSDHTKKSAVRLQELYSATLNELYRCSGALESRAVKRLAILASNFLTLSLGTGRYPERAKSFERHASDSLGFYSGMR